VAQNPRAVTPRNPAIVLSTLLLCAAACADAPAGSAAPPPDAATSSDPFGDLDDDPSAHPSGDRAVVPELSAPPLRERPRGSLVTTCDARGLACAHRLRGIDVEASAAALTAANDALHALAALRLPRPPGDGGRGGDGRLDLYLDPSVTSADAYIEPGSSSPGWDRAPVFIVSPAVGAGCVERQQIASAIGKAVLLGTDAAIEPNALAMLGNYLGVLAIPCGIAELEAIDTAQRAPERTFTGERGSSDAASFLFPWFLEDRYGTGEPGKLTVALAAISGQRTKLGAPLIDEPDVLDALRVTQHQNGGSIADTLLDFAVARAFLGDRSDEAHMLDVAKYGALGRVRFDWSVPHASLPRTLKPLRPIEPLGATYLYVDLKGVAETAELTFVADWEAPAAFRWALVRLDAAGSELGRKELFPVLGSTHVEATVRDLRDAVALLIVGINEGQSRRDAPFDPGKLREPERSYLVTLYP
jgi:hypothetical protein